MQKIKSAISLKHQHRGAEELADDTTSGPLTPAAFQATPACAGEEWKHTSYLALSDLGLLNHIPPPEEVQFITLQDHDDYALPEKLLVGHQAGTGYGIYAHWRPHGETQRIDLSVLANTKQTSLNISDLPQHRILHPYDKTYASGSLQLDGSDRYRFTALVRWYFIAAGFVKGRAVQRDYGKLLKKALLYV